MSTDSQCRLGRTSLKTAGRGEPRLARMERWPQRVEAVCCFRVLGSPRELYDLLTNVAFTIRHQMLSSPVELSDEFLAHKIT